MERRRAAGTRIELRTRTGNEVLETYTYRDKNGKEVTERRYNKLIPSFKGPIDTTLATGGDWSPWSRIYSFSGEAFLSPSPRRYLEIDVRMTLGFTGCGSFSQPLGRQFHSAARGPRTRRNFLLSRPYRGC